MALKVQRNVFQSIDSACVLWLFFCFAVFLFTVSELFAQSKVSQPRYGFFDVLTSTRTAIIKFPSEKMCNMRAL